MRGGYVFPGDYLDIAGQSGYYWSSRVYSNTDYAYGLNFWGGGVNPSYYGHRYYGNSLRCLIPTT